MVLKSQLKESRQVDQIEADGAVLFEEALLPLGGSQFLQIAQRHNVAFLSFVTVRSTLEARPALL